MRTMELARLSLLSLLLGATDLLGQAPRSESVTYRNGDITLAAALLVPPSDRPVPAAVIIQGAGASDRSNGWARQIADELVANGVAVLLTDKRGSGASGGDWRTVGFAELAEDALAGVEMLRRRSEIDSRRIGLIGLSQGGEIAPLAAATSDRVAFVIDVSGRAVGFAEGTFLEMANTTRQAGLGEREVAEVLRLNMALAQYLVTDDWDRYAGVRNEVLRTNAREIARGFPSSPEAPIWGFFRSVVLYDPLLHWLRVSQPVLVVYGEQDERDNVPVHESVRRLEHAFASVGKKDYRILVVPNSGHAVWAPGTMKLDPAFTGALKEWLDTYVIE